MDAFDELYNKLSNGKRELSQQEAAIVVLLLTKVKLNAKGEFLLTDNPSPYPDFVGENVLHTIALPKNHCSSCNRPY